MFTGIIETLGTLRHIEKEGSNIHFTVESNFTTELKIDQSVAHDGVCLTVVSISENAYTVTAIQETLQRTTLGNWKTGNQINLERCMRLGDRLDGHLVQGHVDTTGECVQIEDLDGSVKFHFRYATNNLTVEKGSITVNGVSLTVVDSVDNRFSVSVIPFTLEHTNIKNIQVGSKVNLEFDIIGKYLEKQILAYKK